MRKRVVTAETAAATTKASGPAPVSAIHTLSYPSSSMRRAAAWQAGRSGGSGRLAASFIDPVLGTDAGVETRRLPLLVLHRAPGVAGAAQPIAQPIDELANAADPDVTAAVVVGIDQARNDLVGERRRWHSRHVDAGKRGELVRVDAERGAVEQTHRPRRSARDVPEHRADRGDAGLRGYEHELGVGGFVADERAPGPCEAQPLARPSVEEIGRTRAAGD